MLPRGNSPAAPLHLFLVEMDTMVQVFARRLARLTFGAVLIIGVAMLSTAAWIGRPHGLGDHWPSGVQIVIVTWLAALLAGAVVQAAAARVRWSVDAEALFAESVMLPTAG